MADDKAPRSPRNVITNLWYLSRLSLYETQKPYFVNFPVPADSPDAPPQHNLLHEQVSDIEIHDIRERESGFTLDTHGFELVRHETRLTNDDFENDESIRREYYPEIIDFISKKLGNARVVPFEHTHRLSRPLSKGCGCGRKRKPLVAAHIGETVLNVSINARPCNIVHKPITIFLHVEFP
ncbi:hypothetical protein NLG97_g2456 [Lecanicillium saksenae]|uniref:Uncharacterized protein n=1 Tax=Lecanicillium saksenae TaxID=468837 RepID=A0ACC1R2Q8_9HYPO|nr:hypothetical protein NLG97_g2456 [Lecanicillium saksenae]